MASIGVGAEACTLSKKLNFLTRSDFDGSVSGSFAALDLDMVAVAATMAPRKCVIRSRSESECDDGNVVL